LCHSAVYIDLKLEFDVLASPDTWPILEFFPELRQAKKIRRAPCAVAGISPQNEYATIFYVRIPDLYQAAVVHGLALALACVNASIPVIYTAGSEAGGKPAVLRDPIANIVENFGGHRVRVRAHDAEQIRFEIVADRVVLVVVHDRKLAPDALQPQVVKKLYYLQGGQHPATPD
jgi:hypothetical protein